MPPWPVFTGRRCTSTFVARIERFASGMNPYSQPVFPEIIAHRGASHDAPENSLAAFRLGWEQGADAVELDFRLSRDGHVVVMHDATTRRTGGCDKPVAEQTMDELAQLDIGSWKDPKWAGERIPHLTGVLATVPPDKKAFIEIKCGPEILPALGKDLESSALKPEQIVLIGFNAGTLRMARRQFPQARIFWLVACPSDPGSDRLPPIADLIETAHASGFNGLNLDGHFAVDASTASRIHSAGLGLYCWTVDDPRVAATWKAAGVDGITTNRPAWLRRPWIDRGKDTPPISTK